MIKSFLHAQKQFFVCSFLLLIGLPHANQVNLATPSKDKFFPTHPIPPESLLISPEKNVLLVGIKP